MFVKKVKKKAFRCFEWVELERGQLIVESSWVAVVQF
jgi:hypothetical protein